MTLDAPVLTANDIDARISRAGAVDAITEALRAGQPIEDDPPRLFSPVAAGEFLLMPAETAAFAGVKVATVAPGNTARDLPKIHAWYLLFDAETLRPRAVLEGTHLTLLRTPAVTAVAVLGLLAAHPTRPRTGIDHLAVLGSGPQAYAHVRTLADVVPVGRVSVLGRTAHRVDALVRSLRADGVCADPGSRDALPTADVVVTATSSSSPVLDLADVGAEAVVAAIGSHGTDHRELGASLVRGADLAVEARASAYRESGNLLSARTADEWRQGAQPVANLADLVFGRVRRRESRPAVYTGVGMSWEDLAVVEKIMARPSDGALPPRQETAR